VVSDLEWDEVGEIGLTGEYSGIDAETIVTASVVKSTFSLPRILLWL